MSPRVTSHRNFFLFAYGDHFLFFRFSTLYDLSLEYARPSPGRKFVRNLSCFCIVMLREARPQDWFTMREMVAIPHRREQRRVVEIIHLSASAELHRDVVFRPCKETTLAQIFQLVIEFGQRRVDCGWEHGLDSVRHLGRHWFEVWLTAWVSYPQRSQKIY